jgi:tRNA nucleotidyltransferase/poly(A) polymerase/cation transport regulator ChaC/DNA topoisomerase IB
LTSSGYSKTACVIAGGTWGGKPALLKVRDRNYTPRVKLIRDVVEGTEAVYIWDVVTEWIEGLNEHGIGVVSSALLVVDDETEKKEAKKSRDGDRILEVLGQKTLKAAVKKAVENKISGHTLVSDGKEIWAVEFDPDENPEPVSRCFEQDELVVRTNHGIFLEGAGYTTGADRDSSHERRDTAQATLKKLKSPEELAPSLVHIRRKNRAHPNNVIRDTDKMSTSSQMVLVPGDLEVLFYPIPGRVDFLGLEDRLPKGRKPKVKVRVFHYNDIGDDKPSVGEAEGPHTTFRFFTYGSMIGEPPRAADLVSSTKAVLKGYHLAYNRESENRESLVMGTEPGGSIEGVLHEYPVSMAQKVLQDIDRREGFRPDRERPKNSYTRTPVLVETGGKEVWALAFLSNPDHPSYFKPLSVAQAVKQLSGDEDGAKKGRRYLRSLRRFMEQYDIQDDYITGILDGIGSKPDKEAMVSTVALTRHMEASNHRRSMALVKWLSDLARKLGVGEHVYVVGGAVRNFVLNAPIKDIDVMIDSVALRGRDSEWFAKEILKAAPVDINLTTNNYGVALLHVNEEWIVGGEDLKGEDIEIATARKESYGGDGGKGYKPHLVEPATAAEDVCRREFTFNCLMWRLHDLANGPDKAEIVDLTGCGVKDLAEGVMRCPSDPDKTFSDDPSRMVRAIKFLVKYGFRIDGEVQASIRRNKAKLKNIPPSHLGSMLLDFVLQESTATKALTEMDRLGLLDVLKEVIQKDKGLRNTLANHGDNSNVAHMFVLMDFGLPSGKQLGFLDARQVQRVRDITVEMTAPEAKEYVANLNQPKLDNRALMQEFDLKGAEMGRVKTLAREAMLDNHLLAFHQGKLTQAVRRALGGGRSAASSDVQYIGVVLDPMDTQRLIRRYGQLHPERHAHHMTVWHFRDSSEPPMRLPWGRSVNLKVKAHLADDKAQVVVVDAPRALRGQGRTPHITVSTGSGVGPKYSNDLIRKWEEVPESGHPSVSGKVAWVDLAGKTHFMAPPEGRVASHDEDSEGDRRARLQAAKQFPANLLPNVHTVVPARYMDKVPYWDGMKEIVVYRSVPEGITEIRPGDWVTLTRSYARIHGRGTILSKKVPVGHVYWAGTDMNEWFYTPVGSGRVASHTEVVVRGGGKERKFTIPDLSVPLLLGGLPEDAIDRVAARYASTLVLDHGGVDTRHDVPESSMPLLFNATFADAVKEDSEVLVAVEHLVERKTAAWDRNEWATNFAAAAQTNHDALMREAASKVDLPALVAEFLKSPAGSYLDPMSCSGTKGRCDGVATRLCEFLAERGVSCEVWEGTGLIPPLGKDAHKEWLEFAGDQQKFLFHVVTRVGNQVVDLTGAQYGAAFAKPFVKPFSAFKAQWAKVRKSPWFRASSIRVAAKFQKKKEVPKADGKGTSTVYEYSERQIQHRNREKAKRVDKLRGDIGKLRSQYRSDLKSKDDKVRYTALAVGLIDHTFERVGNEGSAKDGHFGVTGWRKKHVTFSDGKATIKYVGKSGVSQEKVVTDAGLVSALKAATEGKGPEDPLCEGDDCRVSAGDVNDYLSDFKVTAKDLRGFHANNEMQTRLKAIRSKGGTLPKDKKKREEKLKAEFQEALEGTADAVGHEAATLKSQYLVPGLEDEFLKDGKVTEKLNKQGSVDRLTDRWLQATKDTYEKEDEEIRRLQRPTPKKKPPRHDLRRETVEEDDKDTRTQGADEDDDLSMNYKRIAALDNLVIRYLFAKDEEAEHKEGETWKNEDGRFVGMNKNRATKTFDDEKAAKAFAEGAKDEDGDEGGGKDDDKAKEKARKERRKQQQAERRKGLEDMREQMKSLFGGFETPEEKALKGEKEALEEQSEADKKKKEAIESKLKPVKDLHAKIKKLREEIKLKDDDPSNDPYRGRGYGGDSLTDIFDEDDYQGEAPEVDPDAADGELAKLRAEEAKLVEEMKGLLAKHGDAAEELKEIDDRLEEAKNRGYEIDEKLRDMGGGYRGHGDDEDSKDGFKLKQDEQVAQRARKHFESMSADEQIAVAASYKEAMDAMTKEWAGEGLTDQRISAAVKTLKNPFAGVSKATPEERGRMLAEYAFAQRFVLDPSVVSGEPVSDTDEPRDKLEERALAAAKVYERLTPELRATAAEMVSRQLAHADPDSPEYDQLMASAHGLYTAAMMVVDEDGRPETVDIKGANGERLFPVPTERGSALARQMKKNGDMKLMFAPPGKFFEPAGREAVGRALDSLNDKQLRDVVAEEWQEILDLLNEVDDYGIPVVNAQVKNFIRGFVKAEAINDMTIVQGFVEATAKANGIDDVKAIFDEGRKMRSALADNDDLKAARKALLKCMRDAGSDPDKNKACQDQFKKIQTDQVQALSDYVEDNHDVQPDPTNPSVARARGAVKNGDPEVFDLELHDPDREAA